MTDSGLPKLDLSQRPKVKIDESISKRYADALQGGGSNTGYEAPQQPTVSQALKTVALEDFTQLHKKPCARESLLVGMGAGFGLGGLRWIVGGMQHVMVPFTNPSTGWTSLSYMEARH